MKLPLSFYQQPTVTVARELLGAKLYHQTAEGLTVGIIVETEAYLGRHDPAAHSYRGPSSRTATMFAGPGNWYVYFIYGLHTCCNVTTHQAGLGEAVLIRALEPTDGLELMRQRRQLRPGTADTQLCKGPARLTQAMGISLADNGLAVTGNKLWIETNPTQALADAEITQTTRVGITKAADQPYRWYITGNPHISKK